MLEGEWNREVVHKICTVIKLQDIVAAEEHSIGYPPCSLNPFKAFNVAKGTN